MQRTAVYCYSTSMLRGDLRAIHACLLENAGMLQVCHCSPWDSSALLTGLCIPEAALVRAVALGAFIPCMTPTIQ